MDAFFASIEQRDRPDLRGVPVIVGGSPDHRGVVATCSYEARRFGVRSAMAARTALRLCPSAVLIRPNHRKYIAVSRQVRNILNEVSDLVEPVSIDEAYLDLRSNKLNFDSGRAAAEYIRARVKAETGLTCSAGVAPNKFLAKTASDFRKPDGLTVIEQSEAEPFLDALPIKKFHGIGQVTAARLESMNIRTGADLRKLDLETLRLLFGKMGDFYYNIVRGMDDRRVEPESAPKSISREITLDEDCSDLRELRIMVRTLARKVARRARNKGFAGHSVTLKIKYADFQSITRSVSREDLPFTGGPEIGDYAVELLRKTAAGVRSVRLVGVGLGALRPLDAPVEEQPRLPFRDS